MLLYSQGRFRKKHTSHAHYTSSASLPASIGDHEGGYNHFACAPSPRGTARRAESCRAAWEWERWRADRWAPRPSRGSGRATKRASHGARARSSSRSRRPNRDCPFPLRGRRPMRLPCPRPCPTTASRSQVRRVGSPARRTASRRHWRERAGCCKLSARASELRPGVAPHWQYA